MMSRRVQACALAVVMLAGVSGCGPADDEAGAAVLLAAPAVILTSMLVFRLLLWLWRGVDANLVMNPRIGLVAAGAMAGLAAAVVLALRARADPFEWVVAAYWMFGTSALALSLLVWRIWLKVRPDTAFSWGPVMGTLVLAAPAPLVALGGPQGGPVTEGVIMAWVATGYAGWVPGPLLLLMIIEVAVRRGRRGRDEGQ